MEICLVHEELGLNLRLPLPLPLSVQWPGLQSDEIRNSESLSKLASSLMELVKLLTREASDAFSEKERASAEVIEFVIDRAGNIFRALPTGGVELLGQIDFHRFPSDSCLHRERIVMGNIIPFNRKSGENYSSSGIESLVGLDAIRKRSDITWLGSSTVPEDLLLQVSRILEKSPMRSVEIVDQSGGVIYMFKGPLPPTYKP